MSDKPAITSQPSTMGETITVYEPVNKDPIDQLNNVLSAIDDVKKQGAPAQNYVNAFDPKSDDYHVQTGNASVTQVESIRSMFSTGPEIRESDLPLSPVVIGIGLVIGFLLLKGK